MNDDTQEPMVICTWPDGTGIRSMSLKDYLAENATKVVPTCGCICHDQKLGCGAEMNDHGECCDVPRDSCDPFARVPCQHEGCNDIRQGMAANGSGDGNPFLKET